MNERKARPKRLRPDDREDEDGSNASTVRDTAAGHEAEAALALAVGRADVLGPQAILHLQRTAGNASVARLLHDDHAMEPTVGRVELGSPAPTAASGVRGWAATGRPMPGFAVQRVPRPATGGGLAAGAPDVRAVVKERYPHLVSSAPRAVEQVQRVFGARYRISRLLAQRQKYETILSEDAPRREALDAQIAKLERVNQANLDIVVPSEKLLSRDILQGVETNAQEQGYRETLYTTLVSRPFIFRVQGESDEYDASKLPRLLELRWSGRTLNESGGMVTWRHLLQEPDFALAYAQVNLGEQIKAVGAMAELVRGMGELMPDMSGKKVGEIYGYVYNTNVKVGAEVGKIGGYKDDKRGEVQLLADLARVKGAKVILRSAKGWLHIFDLQPNVTSFVQLTTPRGWDDSFVYIMDTGRQTPPVWKIITKDVTELEPVSGGWRARRSAAQMGTFQQFAVGAIFGDWFEEESSAAVMGQIFTGVIPIVGEVGAARDVAAGIRKMWNSNTKDGKLQTALALAGLVPVLGSAAKAAVKRGRKAVTTAVQEASGEIEQQLAREIVRDSGGVVRRFPGLDRFIGGGQRAMKEMPQSLADALGGVGGAAERFAKEASAGFEAAGKDAGALVRSLGGDWALVAKALKRTKAGEALGTEMQAWRKAELDRLRAEMGRSRTIVPDFEATGTSAFSSDLDITFKGSKASAQEAFARRYLQRRHGAAWEDVRKLLDLSTFTDPTRLHMYTELLGPTATRASRRAAGRVEKALAREAELNVLAKMLREGTPLPEVRRLAGDLGVPWGRVGERARELATLSNDAMARRQLALKMDALHGRFSAATSPTEKAAIAREMGTLQGKLNALGGDAYVTAGGGYKHVSSRSLGARLEMTAAMRYMAVLDDLQMLNHVLADVRRAGGVTAASAKSMAKYADRLLATAGQLRVIDVASGKAARETYDVVSGLLSAARRDPTKLAEAPGYLSRAAVLLDRQVDAILVEAKRLSQTEVVRIVTKQQDILRDVALVLRTIPKLKKAEALSG